jgi:hypothetical protein
MKASQPPVMSERNVASVVIQNSAQEKDSNTLSEKPSDKSNKKKSSEPVKLASNKKEEEKTENNKKRLQLDKVSSETLDFIEKVLK